MKNIRLQLIISGLIIFLLSLWASAAYAITVTASPNPAQVGQNVAANVTVNVTGTGPCTIVQVNFGDGSPVANIGPFPPTSTTTLPANHSYSAPGAYPITAQSSCGATIVAGPDPSAPVSVSVQCPALTMTTPASLAACNANQSCSRTIIASGGQAPVTYSLISGALPTGMTLSSGGLLSGTPAASGNYTFTVRATDSCPISLPQTSQRAFTLAVTCPALSMLTAPALPPGSPGVAYSALILATGGQGPYTYSLTSGSLPAGLSLSPSGTISGTPTSAGSYTFSITATDSCASGAQSIQTAFTLSIGATPSCRSIVPEKDPTSLPPGFVMQPYSTQLVIGTPPVTFQKISGPSWLSVSPSGLAMGTPPAAGIYPLIVSYTDSCPGKPRTGNWSYSLQITQVAQNISITVSPDNFKAIHGTASAQPMTFLFSTTGLPDTMLQSDRGIFMAGNTVIGEVTLPLQVSIIGSRGVVTETVLIPAAVSLRAEARGTNRISYIRTFGSGTTSQVARAEGSLVTGAGADFSMKRIQLYFDKTNKRAEITVRRNNPGLRAYADINFTGSGLLQGYWEVDGRVLAPVNTHLSFGESVTLDSPEMPSLPTFVAGEHFVRLVITSPAPQIILPEIIYFVTNEEYTSGIDTIKLILPEEEAAMDYGPVKFSWQQSSTSWQYILEVFDALEKKRIFSALIREPEYFLQDMVLQKIFAPGGQYIWKVRGFDRNDLLAAESQTRRFSFNEAAAILPGQIVVVMDSTARPVAELGSTYRLTALEDFDISLLNLKVVIFSADGDISELIKKLSAEPGVVIAQPNYIMKTLAEAAPPMLSAYKVLNLPKLHEQYKGRNVVIGVVDTGVDTSHKDLRGRIIHHECLIRGQSYAAEIHGTAVAGIIAAGAGEFGGTGIAPAAEILALRACRQISEVNPEGECYTSSVAKAIDVAISRKAKVVNMSFGSVAPDRLISKLIEEGAKKGVVFVAPAGNRPKQKGLDFPASHPSVVAVAGTDDNGNPYPNKEIAAKARVSAPATNIFSTVPGDKHNFISGTSMSSAAVSGLIALAIERNGKIDINNLPSFKGNLCRWDEELLKVSLCGK